MSEYTSDDSNFGKWRAYIWPVHCYELKKLIPMLLIFFLISFDYNVLRTMKDTLVVTANASGAEVIPFIKVWVMFPGAVAMTYIFTRLSNRYSREKVFYLMISGFLLYFLIFVAFLYPSRDFLHPNETADTLQNILPEGFKGLVAMFRNWTLTSFYVMSELWSNIILTLLFWGFANQVTRIGEAKRFYGLFGIGANLSGVVAGQASVYLSRHVFNPFLPFGTTAWEQSMTMLVLLVIFTGLAALAFFWWMNSTILTDPRYYDQSAIKQEVNIKGKLSLREAFRYLIRSKYLLSLAIIVISYNLVINLVEVIWKHEVRELYPHPSDYSIYMNQVSTIIGILATLTALFISGNSIRKLGWTFTAMVTPCVLFFTSIGFFFFFFIKDHGSEFVFSLFGATPLFIVVFFGSAQNILCRAAKYSVFDATKEMAFVPLSAECKLKGKAAIDGVCSRLGKSGGSVIHQGLLILFSTLTASAPYVAAFLLTVIAIWIGATRLLGKKFTAITTVPTKPADTSPSITESLPIMAITQGELNKQAI
jgi:ATP:ADP antiporter, AAA family